MVGGKAAGGSGVANAGTIRTLTNSGAINGGKGFAFNGDGDGGAGVFNSGAITKLNNISGATIGGGAGFSFDDGGPSAAPACSTSARSRR